MYTVAMAYSGTGNNKAIKRLLHVAVSDVNDDVRRAAVTGLGFILFRNPSQVPRIVQLLSESYNPHVRQGATLALGIACAGTALPEALELLEPMTKDAVDFVRQGALVAMAMVLVQHNDASSPVAAATPVAHGVGSTAPTKAKPSTAATSPSATTTAASATTTPTAPTTTTAAPAVIPATPTSVVDVLRKKYESIIADKREETMAIFGSVLGQGILDAGGRNVTISLRGSAGIPNMSAVVGMAVFSQFWYWYPYTLFLSLAFSPTGMVGVNKNLEVGFLFFFGRLAFEVFGLYFTLTQMTFFDLFFRHPSLTLFPMQSPPCLHTPP